MSVSVILMVWKFRESHFWLNMYKVVDSQIFFPVVDISHLGNGVD